MTLDDIDFEKFKCLINMNAEETVTALSIICKEYSCNLVEVYDVAKSLYDLEHTADDLMFAHIRMSPIIAVFDVRV